MAERSRLTPTEWQVPEEIRENQPAGTIQKIRDSLKAVGRGSSRVGRTALGAVLAYGVMYGAQNAAEGAYDRSKATPDLDKAIAAAEAQPQSKELLSAQEVAINNLFGSLSPEQRTEKAEKAARYISEQIKKTDTDWRINLKGLLSDELISPDGASFSIDGIDYSLAGVTTPKGKRWLIAAGQVIEDEDSEKMGMANPILIGGSQILGWNKKAVRKAAKEAKLNAAENIMSALGINLDDKEMTLASSSLR